MDPLLLLAPVLLPLAGGALTLFRPGWGPRRRNAFTTAVAVVTSVLVFVLLFSVRREAVALYSFTRGFTISFRVDGMSALFAGMLAVMWPLSQLYAYEYMEHDRGQRSFFAFYLMTYGITLGVAFSANLLTMYVFYEMLTLVTLPLVTHRQDKDSTYAGRMYIVYCVAGAALGFVAVVLATLGGSGLFIYGGSLTGVFSPELMRLVFLLGFFGFGTKAAIFPFHAWLPKASVAPTPVTALLHAVAVVNSGFFAVARLTWFAYGPRLLLGTPVQAVCVLAASFTMVRSAAMALRQRHFKRRLAWSTVSNLSYMLFGAVLLTPEGLLGGLAHMLFHGITKMALFLCAGAFMHVTGKEYLYELNGAGRKMPFTFACYTLGGVSLTGIPLFCGFVSKWTLLTAGLEAGTLLGNIGVTALLLSAFLCAVYTLTVSVRAFFAADGTDRQDPATRDPGWRMLVPIGIFTAANILFGVWTGPVMAFLRQIAYHV